MNGHLQRTLVGLAFIFAILPIAPTAAQNEQQLNWCKGDGGATPELRVKGCTALIQIGSNLALAFSNRGRAYVSLNQYDRAIADYTEAIRLEPTALRYVMRCDARKMAGQLQAALQDCDEAVRLQPNDANKIDSRGETYLKLGKFDAAISDFDAALKLNPKHAAALYSRGVARLKKGDLSRGNADIAAAKLIVPNIAENAAKYSGIKP